MRKKIGDHRIPNGSTGLGVGHYPCTFIQIDQHQRVRCQRSKGIGRCSGDHCD